MWELFLPKSTGAKLNKLTPKLRQYRGLVENFSYLSIIQVVNLLVSLAVVAYLIRVIGEDLYGLVVFAQATIFFLMVIVSFGFQVTATREISIHRDNPDKVNEIFSSVMIIKGLLFILSCGLLIGLTYIIPKARADKLLFYLTMFTAFYEFIFPSWFFQGIEKMRYSTIATVILKAVFFVLILVFVKNPKDYLLVPAFNGVGSVLAGSLCLYWVFAKEKVKFSWQPIDTLMRYFKDSWAIFISNSASQFYVNANKFIIGVIFKGNAAVAMYDVAEKVVLAMKLPHTVLNQAVFPKISKDKSKTFAQRLFYYLAAGEVAMYTVVFFLAPVLVLLIGDGQVPEATAYLKFLALTVPLNALSSYLGIQYLVVNGFKREYTKLVVLSVLIFVVLGIGFQVSGILTVETLIFATVFTEVVAFGLMIREVKKRRLAWV